MSENSIHCIEQSVKDELLEIYQAFADICSRHSLRYWVAYGTMLGAVRHHGFIPWDDDFDVFMLREDYEKFFSFADKELPSYYKTVTYRNCREYPFTFAKIQETRQNVYRQLESETGYVNPQGLYVDVFPLDAKPDGLAGKVIDAFLYGVLFCRYSHLHRAGNHDTFKGKLAGFAGTILWPFFKNVKTGNDFAYNADKVYRMNLVSSSRVRVSNFMARFQKSELIMPRSAFDETLDITFETISVPVPKGYDACLRAMYGSDYMTPPPIEKRVSEHSLQETAPWIYGP